MRLNPARRGHGVDPRRGGVLGVPIDGGVFSFGDAPFHGSTGNIHLNKPIVGMAVTPDGGGYWLVASDGGIFAFGNAESLNGSTGNLTLNKPVIGMVPTHDGGGYWLIASDGGLFAFGDAEFHGVAGWVAPADPHCGRGPVARRGLALDAGGPTAPRTRSVTRRGCRGSPPTHRASVDPQEPHDGPDPRLQRAGVRRRQRQRPGLRLRRRARSVKSHSRAGLFGPCRRHRGHPG